MNALYILAPLAMALMATVVGVARARSNRDSVLVWNWEEHAYKRLDAEHPLWIEHENHDIRASLKFHMVNGRIVAQMHSYRVDLDAPVKAPPPSQETVNRAVMELIHVHQETN